MSSSEPIRNPKSDGKSFYVTPFEGVHTLDQLFEHACTKFANKEAIGSRRLIKVWREERVVAGTKRVFELPELSPVEYETFAQVFEKVKKLTDTVAVYTQLKHGDKIGIYLDTCPQWQLLSQACYRNGIVLATCYANLGEEALIHVINECELTTCIVGSKNVQTLEKYKSQIPTLKKLIIVKDLIDERENYASTSMFEFKTYDDLLSLKVDTPPTIQRPKADDLAVLMYTSGTTGSVPKGVMIGHKHLLAGAGSIAKQATISHTDTYLGYLPLAHVLECAAENAFLGLGAAVGYGTPRTLTERGVGPLDDDSKRIGDIAAVAPTMLAAVPRVLETIRKGALEKVQNASFIRRWLFNKAFDAKKHALKTNDTTPIWDWAVFRNFSQRVGGRLRYIVCGGAPLNPDTQEFMRIVFPGIACVQGWGLTETCGAGTVQPAYDEDGNVLPVCVSNVGEPVESVEVKVVDVPDMGYFSTDKPNPRGELCIRGNAVTYGYYKNPEKTKEDFDEDGWFHTGDIGELHPDHTVSIVDRKKNLVKLSGGEYVAVEGLQTLYGVSPFVSPNGIFVYGDSYQNHVVAIALPQESYVRMWAKQNGFSGDEPLQELCDSEALRQAALVSFREEANKKKKKGFERIADVRFVDDEWTPDNFLTASMKFKRPALTKHYKPIIDEMYKNMK